MEALLMTNASTSAFPPAAILESFVAAVESFASHRLATAPRLGVVSSSSSSNQTTPPGASPLPLPSPPPMAPSPPPTPLAISPTHSLHWNILRLIEGRLHRPLAPTLSPAEQTVLTDALYESLGFLMPSTQPATRQALLDSNVLTALLDQGMAWLWASVTESTSEQVSSVNAMAASIVNSSSATASALFAEAELQAALGL